MTKLLSSLSLQFLDTTPRWLGLSLVCSAGFFITVGVGVMFNLLDIIITPFTLVLHIVAAVSLAAWILNLKIKMDPQRKGLVAVAFVVALGSLWTILQQWVGYLQTGIINDITLVIGAMLMDAAGGFVTYSLFHLKLLRR